jgi:hypothetical protein
MYLVDKKFKELEKLCKIKRDILARQPSKLTKMSRLPATNGLFGSATNMVHNFIQNIGETKRYQPIKLLSPAQMLAFNQVNPHQHIW